MPKDKAVKATWSQRPEVADVREPGEQGPTGVQPLASLAELPVRGRIAHRGYVESITILPLAQAPAFSATVVDHPAPPGGRRSAVPHLRLVFLGQRRVPGLVAGSRIKYEGMVAPLDSVPTVFNPRYEILPERSSR
ncbi:hypothetical protein OIU93_13800 [Paeniglutamicibacter sp. ZC-3]|uniref:hypothetical protein n=1 Tax=Paeniglutamicibacter sp. ZC-3 TaxID=2986919 RepID=UPI0021F6DC93|nr:hypothetical protein [Paeniglutamicibacter sp. ZC-3]MCV9995361.1 hypothetical protein [Paeniglutamicibacter sp. ZC-3]